MPTFEALKQTVAFIEEVDSHLKEIEENLDMLSESVSISIEGYNVRLPDPYLNRIRTSMTTVFVSIKRELQDRRALLLKFSFTEELHGTNQSLEPGAGTPPAQPNGNKQSSSS
jgi:hypothetical protein